MVMVSDPSIKIFIRMEYGSVFALVASDKVMAVMPRIRRMVDTNEIFIMED